MNTTETNICDEIINLLITDDIFINEEKTKKIINLLIEQKKQVSHLKKTNFLLTDVINNIVKK